MACLWRCVQTFFMGMGEMKGVKNEVKFIHSVKAKLLLMGIVSIVGIGVISITMVSILAGINKDTGLRERLEEVSQLQSKTNTLSISYNYSMDQDLLVRMTENLKQSDQLLDQSRNDINWRSRTVFNELAVQIEKEYANCQSIQELSAMRSFQSNAGQYAEFIRNDAKMEAGLEGKINILASSMPSHTYAELCDHFITYTKSVASNGNVEIEREKIENRFKTLEEDIATCVPDKNEAEALLNMLESKKATFEQIKSLDDKIISARKENMAGREKIKTDIVTIEQAIEENMNRRNHFAGTLIIITLVIVIGSVGYVTYWIAKSINGNLATFGKMLDEFANGNLGARANIMSQDEFGVFSKQLNMFAAKLSGVLGQIQLLINEVGNKNLVVANMMRKVANGSDSNQVLEDEGIIYLKRLFSEITENVVNQSANIEESLASIRQQLNVNTDIVKMLEDKTQVGAAKNEAYGVYDAIKEQNISLNEISIAIEQISNEGVEIIDKTKMTNRVTSEMADELINSIETINEVITSSEQLREEVAFFKF